MKRITLAAALLACAGTPFAQYMKPPPAPPREIEAPKQPADAPRPGVATAAPRVEVPKHKCEPRPVFPSGASQMAQENRRKNFERDLENYKACMSAYFDERKAMHEMNAALHKGAIEEYNATVKAINEAQEAAR